MVSVAHKRRTMATCAPQAASKKSKPDVAVDSTAVFDCLPKDLSPEGLVAFLESVWSMMADDDDRSRAFMEASSRLFADLMDAFLICTDSRLLSIFAIILGKYFAESSFSLSDDVCSQIMAHVANVVVVVEGGDDASLLPVCQLFELLTEDSHLHLDESTNLKLQGFARHPLESSLCFAQYLSALPASDVEGLLQAIFKNMCSDGASTMYLGKALRVLANLSPLQPVLCLTIQFIHEQCEGKLASAMKEVPDVALSLGVLLANLVPLMAPDALESLADAFEHCLDTLKDRIEDSMDMWTVYCALMASLSNTGMWAAEAKDVLRVIDDFPMFASDILEHLVPICYYTLKHAQGSPKELQQLAVFLEGKADNPLVRVALNGLNK
jgi:hypothetical protein